MSNSIPNAARRGGGARRLTYAALLAGAIALGAGAFGHTATAHAEFKWSTYKNCMAQPHVEDSEETYHAACCLLAHGTWNANTHTRLHDGFDERKRAEDPAGARTAGRVVSGYRLKRPPTGEPGDPNPPRPGS